MLLIPSLASCKCVKIASSWPSKSHIALLVSPGNFDLFDLMREDSVQDWATTLTSLMASFLQTNVGLAISYTPLPRS